MNNQATKKTYEELAKELSYCNNEELLKIMEVAKSIWDERRDENDEHTL